MRLRPFRLERFFATYEFQVRHVLCASDCESVTVGELLELEPGAAERLHGQGLGYTESQGAPELRREIASLYERIAPDDVLVHAGAEEAIFGFMNAALEPGDHVIVHAPSYPSLEEVARAIGCDVTRWEAREEDGWAIDPDALRRSLRGSTRLVVFNSPHNPTGWQMDPERFRAVLDLAAERGILVFSDEVYRFLEPREEERLPAACDRYENAVSLGVMSKAFGLAGLRIGWVATRNRKVLEAMAAFKDYTTICSSAPSEVLAAVALRHRERLVRRNREIIASNVALLDDFFRRHAEHFSWVAPRAGSVAFPRYHGAEGSERFCLELVEATGALLLPGRLFDAGDRHFRIGLGRRGLEEGLGRVEEFLRTDPRGG